MQKSFDLFLPSLLHNDQALLKHSVVSLLQGWRVFFGILNYECDLVC